MKLAALATALLFSIVVGPGEFGPGDGGSTVPVTAVACNDGIDNDGDGAIDYAGGAGDIECTSAADTSELWTPPGLSVGTTITIAADLGASSTTGVGPVRAVHYDLRDAISTTSASGAGDVGETNDMRVLWCYLSFGSSMGDAALGVRGHPANKWWGPCGSIASAHIAELEAGNSVDSVYVTVVDLVDGSYKIGGPVSITTTDPMVAYTDADTVCVATTASWPNCPSGVTDKVNSGTDFDAMCEQEFVTDSNALVLVEPGAWVATDTCDDLVDDDSIIGLGTWDVDTASQRIEMDRYTVTGGQSADASVFSDTGADGAADRARVSNFALYLEDAETHSGTQAQQHSGVALGSGNTEMQVSRLVTKGFTTLASSGPTSGTPSTNIALIDATYSEPNCSDQTNWNSAEGGTGTNAIYSDRVQGGILIDVSIDKACHLTNSTRAGPSTDSYLEHGARLQDWMDGVMRAVTITNQADEKHGLALRGDEHNSISGTYDGVDSDTPGWTITDSDFGGYLDNDSSALPVQIGPQNASVGLKSEKEELVHGLIYGNRIFTLAADATVQQPTYWSIAHSTIMGNLWVWKKTTHPPSGSQYLFITKRGANPTDIDLSDNHISYNTFATEDSTPGTGDTLALEDCGATTDSVIANNLYIVDSGSTFEIRGGSCASSQPDNLWDDEAAIVSAADTDFRDYFLTASPSPALGVYQGLSYDVDSVEFTDSAGLNQP